MENVKGSSLYREKKKENTRRNLGKNCSRNRKFVGKNEENFSYFTYL